MGTFTIFSSLKKSSNTSDLPNLISQFVISNLQIPPPSKIVLQKNNPILYTNIVFPVSNRYKSKYNKGQTLHRELHKPLELADWIIDNNDWKNPQKKHARAEVI